MFQLLDSFVADAETLIRNAILVLAIVFVAWTWWRTKALTSTMGALLFAAVVVWGVNNVDVLSGVVEKDVDNRIDHPNRQHVDPRAG